MKEKYKKIRRLFFDLEVSYNTGWFWKPSYKMSMDASQILTERQIICVCYKWEGDNRVYHFKWNKGDDEKLCKDFYKIIKEADEVVGHNSNKFDLPWFKTRCIYHNLPPLPEIKSIDTLRIARGMFNFNSNRLDYLGKFLRFGGKKDAGGIDTWHKIIQNNDEKAMQHMVSYCNRDVLLLEKVYKKLQKYSTPKTHIGILNGGSNCSCPRCGSEKTISDGNIISASSLRKKKMWCKSCDSYFSISESKYLTCRINNKNKKNK